MIRKNSITGVIVIFLTIILQTTILGKFTFRGIKPDYVLIMVILISNYRGSIKGQLLGFTSGLIEDFLSLSPLGFNSLVNTVIGYLAGITSEKIFLDPILVPVVFIFIGTLLKTFLSFLIFLIFLKEKADFIYTSSLLIEIGMNIILTPFIYMFLKVIRVLPISTDSRIS